MNVNLSRPQTRGSPDGEFDNDWYTETKKIPFLAKLAIKYLL